MRMGNIRANMYIYKMAAENSSESAIVLEDKGDVGKYNRANRTLHHFLENSIPFVMQLIINSMVYPIHTFIFGACYLLGRVVYTMGYSGDKGFDGRMPGYLLQLLSGVVMVGFTVIIAFKGFCLDAPTPY